MNILNSISTTTFVSFGLYTLTSTEICSNHINQNKNINSNEDIKVCDNNTTRFINGKRYSLEQLKLNLQKLNSLKLLKKNWNNYGSEVIDSELIDKISSILPVLDYQPQVFPTGRGTLQLERFVDNDNLIEIEIAKNEILALVVINGKESEKIINLSQINDVISSFYV